MEEWSCSLMRSCRGALAAALSITTSLRDNTQINEYAFLLPDTVTSSESYCLFV